MLPLWRKGCAAAFIAFAIGLAATCGITSARWVHTTFPGFLVMDNRVVASVSLPHWPVAHRSPSSVYQHVVIAVNGQPVVSSADLYALVRRLPSGVPVTYTLEKDGQLSSLSLPTVTFLLSDYVLLFVAYLFNGLALAFIGVGVWFLKPATPASLALFLGGITSGLFTLTAADLYGPHWFFRLHVLGEAFFPAGFIHLALVFPVDRLRRRRALVLAVPYLVALALGTAYELWLYHPSAYSLIHSLCMVYVGVGAVIFVGRVVQDYLETTSLLIRQRIRVVLLGFLGGFALPAGLMFASGVTGGDIAVNYAAFTAFLFPLSLGYAVVKHDLFDIDAFLKRGVYYLALTVTLGGGYLCFLTLLDLGLHSSEWARSPLFHLLFTLIVVFLFNPLKDHVQHVIDRLFFRLRYNPRKVLEVTSAFLAATLRFEDILAFLWRTIGGTLGVTQGGIFLYDASTGTYAAAYPPQHPLLPFRLSDALLHSFQQGKKRVFSLYDLSEGAEETLQARDDLHRLLAASHAQLAVSLLLKGELLGLIILGQKESGSFFTADDGEFLATLANQSVLSISNARAYQAIQEFNAALEQKVDARTQELARTNEELQALLQQLEQAYRDLQYSQENLLRAEKMAALGRLTAGIAHEMNTPLGASLTSLKLLQDLVVEYRSSIDNPLVNAGDHRDIAAEMYRLVRATRQWVDKAAAHIRSLKTHTRDLQRDESRSFSVVEVVDDTGLLLSHRLRLSRCSLLISCTATDPVLYGDPGKLGQVLTNLIVNAIDAYVGVQAGSGEIFVHISEADGGLEVRVRDHGSGIPPDHLERIFDDFFSTKPLGEGTGLGLPIARTIITNFFGGELSVTSTPGQGSEFIVRLPRENAVSISQPQLLQSQISASAD
ncbi:MAG: hypothetical protein HYZ50_25170 [Deltaproteobacteria bacterium]|nr:hypothetical protein [Deltaproteobacteria bacterium]